MNLGEEVRELEVEPVQWPEPAPAEAPVETPVEAPEPMKVPR